MHANLFAVPQRTDCLPSTPSRLSTTLPPVRFTNCSRGAHSRRSARLQRRAARAHCTRAASALLSPMRAAIQLWNPNRAALGGRAHASLTKTQPIDRSEPHGVLATPALAVRARTLRASLSLREIERARKRSSRGEKRKKPAMDCGRRCSMWSLLSVLLGEHPPWRLPCCSAGTRCAARAREPARARKSRAPDHQLHPLPRWRARNVTCPPVPVSGHGARAW